MEELLDKFKSHIHWEEGMDESMLSLYLDAARKYVKQSTGKETEYLILLVAGIMYEYRISEQELKQALDAITPFMVQEVYAHVEENDEQTEVDG